MPRRYPQQDEAKATEEETGGAPGIPIDPSAKTEIPTAEAAPGKPAEAKPVEVAVDRFRVLPGGPLPGGEWPVLYRSVRTKFPPGKIIDTATYDVPYIRSQGVKMEPVEAAPAAT